MAARGGLVEPAASVGKAYPGKLTDHVVSTCVVAATGGLIFGYELGISGGVTSMNPFLKKFFPEVYTKENAHNTITTVNLFQHTLAVGAVVNVIASHLWMPYVGSMLLGFGIALFNQKWQPYKFRGALNVLFQWAITIGMPSTISLQKSKEDGLEIEFRRTSGACGCHNYRFFLPSGHSKFLLERGHKDREKAQLLKLRGVDNVDEEFNDIDAFKQSSRIKHE